MSLRRRNPRGVPRKGLSKGLNAIEPDQDDPDVGEFRVRYAVVGARYSFDSFKRMVYLEYRINEGRLTDGSRLKDEVTVGIRWDFGD